MQLSLQQQYNQAGDVFTGRIKSKQKVGQNVLYPVREQHGAKEQHTRHCAKRVGREGLDFVHVTHVFGGSQRFDLTV